MAAGTRQFGSLSLGWGAAFDKPDRPSVERKKAGFRPGLLRVGCVGLLDVAPLLLAGAFASEGLLGAAFVAGLEVERVLLDVLDDVFLLDLPLEPAERTLN
jgi:hypothetical protein